MNRALTVTLSRLRRWTPNPREHLFSEHLNKPIEESDEPKKRVIRDAEYWWDNTVQERHFRHPDSMVTEPAHRHSDSHFIENLKMNERLLDILPPITIPSPPMNQPFPTPTGWRPADPSKTADLPFHVERNRFHEFAISEEQRGDEMYDLNYDNRYEDKWDKMRRKRDPARDVPFTHLDGVTGDIFQLRGRLVNHLEAVTGEPIAARADEPNGRITVTGRFYDLIEDFLFDQGF